MTKGTRRERQCVQIYEDAGFRAYSPSNVQYGENDILGLFDVVAVRPDRAPYFVQVKSNRASGINAWRVECLDVMPYRHSHCCYAVPHDGEGWRLIGIDDNGHTTLFDGRDSDTNMGDGLTEFLE